ncbi:hypothetical protein AMR41_11370 [Hapalosiphon sp. MRB220]|nr:hypothetical protein AMR41_11370 [Hapalosiphon sp. MRB220]
MRQITVRQNGNSCIIRWTYEDESYSLTWGKWVDKVERARLEICAQIIYRDCLAGEFDASLTKYRCWLLGITPTVNGNGTKQKEPKLPALTTLLEQRIEELYNSADDALLRLLKRYKKQIKTVADAKEFMKWLSDRKLKDSTRKRYLAVLQVLRKDLFGELKVKVAEKPIPKPFTLEEVKRILEYLKNSQYYSHYYTFILFLFNTGCRVSEAIGVRWQDVDLAKREIHIYESLARNKGSSSNRQRKPTKTSKYRIIPINNTLFELLSEMKKGKPDDLIFISPKGLPIDDHNLSQRCWRKTLEELRISHRPLKSTRSTFVSHCISSGMTVQETASITGHDIRILIKYYLGSVKKPKLPEL